MTAAGPLLDRMAGRSVLVVGDVMLDHFVYGRVTRISPEAPVPVVQFERDEFRLGGASNVAANIVALGGRAAAIGIVGADTEGARLIEELRRVGVDAAGIVDDTARCTTRKLRVVTTRNQQVARVDYEDDREAAGSVETALVECASRLAAHAGAIVVSDYLKGCVTRRLVGELVVLSKQQSIPLLVDPKIPHIDYYRGASLVTPNHHEAEVATHTRIRTDEEAAIAAQRFRERAGCEGVLITRGEHGMWLLDGDVEGVLPATARDVADVTGAGDTVIATLALALAAGATLAEAARLANHAAGLVVAKFGPATVSVEELLEVV